MDNFWDYSVWSAFNIIAVMLVSLLIANVLKKSIKFLRKSLIPTSVLAGIMLFIIACVYNLITDRLLFNEPFFGGKGYSFMEMIAYHMLALGFIASTLQSNKKKMTKQRSKEIFDSGLTTVSTYLLQGVIGIGITLIVALIATDFFPAAGVLLPFGYGQGTGQAMNYGNIYETDYGFVGGKSFGLTIAAFGFLSAAIGGVIHLMILKKRNPALMENIQKRKTVQSVTISGDDSKDGSLGKLTIQIILCVLAYGITYGIMLGLGTLIPSFRSVIYGFNFLFGVISAVLIKAIINFFKKKRVIKQEVTNNYLLANVGNFCFDLMIVAGIGAIRLDIIGKYWAILLILGVVGAVITFIYTRFVAKKLFPNYAEEQFLATYGMLTGTASTGIVLLREIDPDFQTEAANNLVYQTLPAIVFGFPMMLLATIAPKQPLITLGIMAALLVAMNILLFRSKIFRRRKRVVTVTDGTAPADLDETTSTESVPPPSNNCDNSNE